MQLTISDEVGMKFLTYVVKTGLYPDQALEHLIDIAEKKSIEDAEKQGFL